MVNKKCVNCGIDYQVSPYRITSRYCSYRCSGTHRKAIQYAEKKELIQKFCECCKSSFYVQNRVRTSKRKTCSKECMNKLQSKALSEAKKNQIPRIKNGRRYINKTCVICDNKFEVNSSRSKRTQCCSRECGYILSSKTRGFMFSKDEFIYAVDNSINTYEICDKLKCSLYSVMRASKRFDIPYKKNKEVLRSDGYFNYGSKNNHRIIYQKETGITLLPKQSVHHIDGDKTNNLINNLIHSEGVSSHIKMHGSLQKAAFILVRSGIINFNRETREYYISDKIK